MCYTDANKKDQLSLFSKNQPPKKRRKSRTAFTNQQIYELEKRFLYQKYLTPADRDEIAQNLGLTNAQVITWFQNRRAKLKRDLEEIKADMVAAKTVSTSIPQRSPVLDDPSQHGPQLPPDLYSKQRLSPHADDKSMSSPCSNPERPSSSPDVPHEKLESGHSSPLGDIRHDDGDYHERESPVQNNPASPSSPKSLTTRTSPSLPPESPSAHSLPQSPAEDRTEAS